MDRAVKEEKKCMLSALAHSGSKRKDDCSVLGFPSFIPSFSCPCSDKVFTGLKQQTWDKVFRQNSQIRWNLTGPHHEHFSSGVPVRAHIGCWGLPLHMGLSGLEISTDCISGSRSGAEKTRRSIDVL